MPFQNHFIVLSHQNQSPPEWSPGLILAEILPKPAKIDPGDQFWQPKVVPHCQKCFLIQIDC